MYAKKLNYKKYNPKNFYKYIKNKLSSHSFLPNMFDDANELNIYDFNKANSFL